MNRWFWIGIASVALVAWVAPATRADDKEPAAKSEKTEKGADAKAKPAESRQAKAANEREVKVTIRDLPSPVRRTLERESYGGQVKEIERETKSGKTVFEADVKLDGSVYAVVIAADGKLLSKTLDDDDDEDDDDDDDDDDGEDDDDNVAARTRAAPRR